MIVSVLMLGQLLLANLASDSLALQVLPYPISETHEDNVVTPWGNAHSTESIALDDNRNIFYSFTEYRFDTSKSINIDLLDKYPQYFLANKKCIARTVTKTKLTDRDGVVWPQISFQGHCATSYSDYRVLVLVADNRVYQFHVGYLQQPQSPELLHEGDLDVALKNFVGRFRNQTVDHKS